MNGLSIEKLMRWKEKTHFNELLNSVFRCFYHQDAYQMACKNEYHMGNPDSSISSSEHKLQFLHYWV